MSTFLTPKKIEFQGYFAQLTTMQEVKEQVFNYLNVMARPLVLKNSKKIAWTSLYAHKTVSFQRANT